MLKNEALSVARLALRTPGKTPPIAHLKVCRINPDCIPSPGIHIPARTPEEDLGFTRGQDGSMVARPPKLQQR